MAEQTNERTAQEILQDKFKNERTKIITAMNKNITSQYKALEKLYPGFCKKNGIIFDTPEIFSNERESKEFQLEAQKSKADSVKRAAMRRENALPFALNVRPDEVAPAGEQNYVQPDFSAFTADPMKQYYQNIVANLPTDSMPIQQQAAQSQDIPQQQIPQQQPSHPIECDCGHDHQSEEESAEQVTQRLKNQYPILVSVENLIKVNNCTCQFGSEGNGMIFVMVGNEKSVMDPSRFFAIDLGGNILNRKDKWFPCALPATGYGYEDYPCYELKLGEGCILEYFIKKEMPEDAQMIVGPDQLELNKYIDVVDMPKCENAARAAIMSRLKKAMKSGMFTQENAGMWGTRYRIVEIKDGNNFKLVNDAPIRFGYPVVIPAKRTEIVFQFSNATINYLM